MSRQGGISRIRTIEGLRALFLALNVDLQPKHRSLQGCDQGVDLGNSVGAWNEGRPRTGCQLHLVASIWRNPTPVALVWTTKSNGNANLRNGTGWQWGQLIQPNLGIDGSNPFDIRCSPPYN
jgi:hypothetical protein